MKFMVEIKDEAFKTNPTVKDVARAINNMVARGLSMKISDVDIHVPNCFMENFHAGEAELVYWGYQKS